MYEPNEWKNFKPKTDKEAFDRHIRENVVYSGKNKAEIYRAFKIGRKRPRYCELHESMILPPPSGKRPVADHDHKTGKYRGWLCNRCNTGIVAEIDRLRNLGVESEDIKAFLRRAVDYVFIGGDIPK